MEGLLSLLYYLHNILGHVFLEKVEPRVEYIEFSINGQTRIFRDGDLIDVKSKDRFKLENVKLNLSSTANLTYKLVRLRKYSPGLELPMGENYRYYELIVYYQDKTLLTFPMRVWDEA